MPDMSVRSGEQVQPSGNSQPLHSESVTIRIHVRSFPRYSCRGEALYLVDFLQPMGEVRLKGIPGSIDTKNADLRHG